MTSGEERVCSHADCDLPVLSRGMCSKHYRTWARHNTDKTRKYRKRKGNRKECARCEQVLPLSMYYQGTGHNWSYCIPCYLAYRKEWRRG
jgi:hypothetical protein